MSVFALKQQGRMSMNRNDIAGGRAALLLEDEHRSGWVTHRESGISDGCELVNRVRYAAIFIRTVSTTRDQQTLTLVVAEDHYAAAAAGY